MESVRKLEREFLYVLTIAIGLPISAYISEWPVNIWCWSVFGYIYKSTNRKERIEMLTVLAFATPVGGDTAQVSHHRVLYPVEAQQDSRPDDKGARRSGAERG